MLLAFAAAYAGFSPPAKTWEGKVRQRQGGSAKGVLAQMAAQLLSSSSPSSPIRAHHARLAMRFEPTPDPL